MDETLRQQVTALQEMSDDREVQQALGKRLLEQVAAAIADEKRGVEIADPDFEMGIQKGDIVPAQFRDRVATDAEGRALQDFTAQAQSLIIWLRVWIRFWLRVIVVGPVFRGVPLQRFEEFTDRLAFEPEEIALIRQLRQLSG
jgi:hypothetical protein